MTTSWALLWPSSVNVQAPNSTWCRNFAAFTGKIYGVGIDMSTLFCFGFYSWYTSVLCVRANNNALALFYVIFHKRNHHENLCGKAQGSTA